MIFSTSLLIFRMNTMVVIIILQLSFYLFLETDLTVLKSITNLINLEYTENKGQFEASIQNLYNVFDTSHGISSLCSLAFSTVISYFDEACKKEYSTIETVYKYIEENHAKMITLDEILQIYPYSKAKLCREFKMKYNLTIFEMVTKIRLRHARYMINNYPNTRLESIATSCGFNDVSYFCKMYKRAYGFSPKASKN